MSLSGVRAPDASSHAISPRKLLRSASTLRKGARRSLSNEWWFVNGMGGTDDLEKLAIVGGGLRSRRSSLSKEDERRDLEPGVGG